MRVTKMEPFETMQKEMRYRKQSKGYPTQRTVKTLKIQGVEKQEAESETCYQCRGKVSSKLKS